MSTRDSQADKIRLQFDFSPEAYEDLRKIQEDLGAVSRAETIRYALRTLQWLISMTKEGTTFLVQRQDEQPREVMFPFLRVPVESSPQHGSREEVSATSASDRSGRRVNAALQHSH